MNSLYAREDALRTIRILSSLTLLAGIWLFISPFVMGLTVAEGPMVNFMLIGAAIVVFALIRVVRPERFEPLSWTNALLGLWLILAPFAVPYTAWPGAVLNSVIVGIIVTFVAAADAMLTRRAHFPIR